MSTPFMNEPLKPLRERTLERIILDVLQSGGGVRIERVWNVSGYRHVEVHVRDEHGKTKAFVISEVQWRGTREEFKGIALRDALNECERRVFG